MKYDVFITHATKDQGWAEALCCQLERRGIHCFLACRDIPTGGLVAAGTLKALDEAAMMMVVYTRNYNSTPQMNREIEVATRRDIPVITVGQADGEELLQEVERYVGWIAAMIGGIDEDDNEDENGFNINEDDNDDEDGFNVNEDEDENDNEDENEDEDDSNANVDVDLQPNSQPNFQPDSTASSSTDVSEVGDANDCYRIAEAYYYGNGVVQNYDEAAKWYEKAAQMGHQEAQCDLGNCYYYGEGLPENYERSVYWYEKAAEQGNVRALYNLGNSYYYGEGVAQNRGLAMAYYDRAAALGSTHAKKRLEELMKG